MRQSKRYIAVLLNLLLIFIISSEYVAAAAHISSVIGHSHSKTVIKGHSVSHDALNFDDAEDCKAIESDCETINSTDEFSDDCIYNCDNYFTYVNSGFFQNLVSWFPQEFDHFNYNNPLWIINQQMRL